MNILVTGGSGFIGSAFIRVLLASDFKGKIVNLDKLTYAAFFQNHLSFEKDDRYDFVVADICDQQKVEKICKDFNIDTIIHFAAETHVDRSIMDPSPFIQTNIIGTFSLLEIVRKIPSIYFHHVSTDEVYGSCLDKEFFSEQSPYQPNSPYAASKASSDHLVRSYVNTYGIKATISHCSNNYGPNQYHEKFIPHMIFCLLQQKPLPVYGQGKNIRDWLYVDDHVQALLKILQTGKKGEVYDIGGNNEMTNIELLYLLIDLFCEKNQYSSQKYHSLVTFVKDRPGHDFRYAIDCSKIKKELGWEAKYDLRMGLKTSLDWYCDFFSNKQMVVV